MSHQSMRGLQKLYNLDLSRMHAQALLDVVHHFVV